MAAPDPKTTDHRPDEVLNVPEFAEIIEYFKAELPERVRSLKSCGAERDLDGLQRLAHHRKVAAPGWGFPAVGQAARELEERLRFPAVAEPYLDQVRGELNALISLCRSYYTDADRAA